MARPGARPDDYPGDPLGLIVGYTLYWLDVTKTQLKASWIPASGVEVNSRWIKYLNGIIVERSEATSYVFTVPVPGVIPNLAVVAVPAACDQDGAYDPLQSDPTAVNLFFRYGRVIVGALVAQRVGNRSGLRVGIAAALSAGNRSSLGVGIAAALSSGNVVAQRVGNRSGLRVGNRSSLRVGIAAALSSGNVVAQRVGNRSGLRVGIAAALSAGNRSSLGVGVKVGA